jgi:gas vesicle protein
VARTRHNAAFVVGSVLGGLVGAGVALWKTPYSGSELRSMLSGGSTGHDGAGSRSNEPLRFSSKLLSQVENTLAPVVGVKLGKTANDSGPATAPVEREVTISTATSPMGDAHREVEPDTEANAATIEQLTHPQIEVQPEALTEETGEMKPFPTLGGNEPTR